MLLSIPLYPQATDFTCGACATLMVWNYFDGNIHLSKRNEFLIWTEIVALPFKFSSPYGIAAFFIKKGFKTKLIMKQETNLEGELLLECCQTDPAERKLFVDFFKAHSRILKKRITSALVDRNPAVYDIKKALSNRNPVIALVDSYYTTKIRGAKKPPHLPHWIVVRGYQNGTFYINDSIHEQGLKSGKIRMEEQLLTEAMETYSKFKWPSALITIDSKRKRSDSPDPRHAKSMEQKC